MNKELVFVNEHHKSVYNMEDSQFSYKTLQSNVTNNLVEVEKLIDEKRDEAEIPIVCLDGVIYTLENGELSELDPRKFGNDSGYSGKAEVIISDSSSDSKQVSVKSSDNDSSSEINDESPIEMTLKNKRYLERCEEVLEHSNEIQLGEKNLLNANDFVEVVSAFKCKICPFTTQDRGQLLKHFGNAHVKLSNRMKNIKEEPDDKTVASGVKLLYMCGECSNCFPSMQNCREHMINDHQLMDKCTSRGLKSNVMYTTDTKRKQLSPQKVGRLSKVSTKIISNDYENNKKSVQIKERKVKCLHRGCSHKFTSEEMMQKHKLCHVDAQNVNMFKCNICSDAKFTKWKTCSSHLWKKHEIDIDLLSCNICNAYKSVTSVKLLTHMRIHSDIRDYECRDCGKRFKQSSQLRNHRIMHLDRKTVDGPRWYTSKICEMCGKTYADSKCLKNHVQAVHAKLRPYVCNVCGHASARKAMLQMHLRQHTGDKPFNCDICDFKTGDHNSLRRHIMRHTGVRPYKCPHCSYSAIQSSSYKNHLRAKHPLLSGLYTCEICQFKTVKKESYAEHMDNHAKGLIKSNVEKNDDINVEVFPGNMAAAQLIYSCLGAFSEVGKTIEASLMSSSTSVDGTLQTITIQIPSTQIQGSLPMAVDSTIKNSNTSIDQDDEETMHCFLKIPYEEEESIDTGGITIPADPQETGGSAILNVDS